MCPLCVGELLLSPEAVLFLSNKLEKGGTVPFFAKVLGKPLHQGYMPERGECELFSCKLPTGLGAAEVQLLAGRNRPGGCSCTQGKCGARQGTAAGARPPFSAP